MYRYASHPIGSVSYLEHIGKIRSPKDSGRNLKKCQIRAMVIKTHTNATDCYNTSGGALWIYQKTGIEVNLSIMRC